MSGQDGSIDLHGSKFWHGKYDMVTTYSARPVEDGAFGTQGDGQANEHHRNQEDNSGDEGNQYVNKSF